MKEPTTCTYELDADLQIIWVDAQWLEFAIANHAPEQVSSPGPLGQSALSCVADSTSALLYERLFHRVLQTRMTIALPFRGDAPARHRYLNMIVKPRTPAGLRIEVTRCIAIGHSWGSMTAIRAAIRVPSRFAALGLFNMPFRRNEGLGRLGFQLQKHLTVFPRFYARQAARALYTEGTLKAHPEYSAAMQDRLSARPLKEISRVIDAVLLNPQDGTHLFGELKVPALAVVGQSDYVGRPPSLNVTEVVGGHISPHEAPEGSRNALKHVVLLAGDPA